MSLRISILGMGNMGSNHLRVLSMLDEVLVTKIFDTDEAKLELHPPQHILITLNYVLVKSKIYL